MVHLSVLAATAASLLVIPTALGQGLYMKNSPVLQVDSKSYDSLITNSNYTSIVEFYAPWCGHCKNLKPSYEKAAKALNGLAKVAAVNCDEELNKPLCGRLGVSGFPTLKIVRPGKKPGRPAVEDYQGPREAKGIVDAVKSKIQNHVKRLSDKTLDEWLVENPSTPKAILFSDKGTTSPLLKALAIDYLGSISVGQLRNKETASVERYGITTFPALILLAGSDSPAITYDGEMTKDSMSKFLSQVAEPNPDPAPKKAKSSKSSSKDTKKASKASSSFSAASASHASADSASSRATQTSETVLNDSPTESPNPNVVDSDTQKPIKIPDVAPPLPTLLTATELQQACLTTKSSMCLLALVSETESEDVPRALSALSEIHSKHTHRGGKGFPFYAIPASNPQAASLRSALSLKPATEMEILTTNAKKSWVKKYTSELNREGIESWIDAIKMGEGAKETLPGSLIVEAAEAKTETEEPQVKVESVQELSDEEVEALLKKHTEAPVHGEL